MSRYSDSILRDSPEIIFPFDEGSGSVASSYAYALQKEGQYLGASGSNIKWAKIPLVYGERNSPTLNVDGDCIKLPALGYLSSTTRNMARTIEFWLKISNSTTEEVQILRKPNDVTGLYVKDNYLIFKAGNSSSNYAYSYIDVDTWNQPLNVYLVYTSTFIQIIVNGREGNVSYFNSPVFTRDLVQEDDWFIFTKSPDIDKVSIDCFAMYPSVVGINTTKRHYVYGVGYDLEKRYVSNSGGVMYSMSMKDTIPVRAIDYVNERSYPKSILYDNVIFVNNKPTIRKFSPPILRKLVDGSESPVDNFYSNKVSFHNQSGLYNGTFLDINIPYPIIGETSNGFFTTFELDKTKLVVSKPQILFSIYSATTKQELSYFIEKTDTSTIKIYLSSKKQNGDSVLYNSQSNIIIATIPYSDFVSKFVVGYVLDKKNNKPSIKSFVYTNSTTNYEYLLNVEEIRSNYPILDAKLRFGASKNIGINYTKAQAQLIDSNIFTGSILNIKSVKLIDLPNTYDLFQSYKWKYLMSVSNNSSIVIGGFGRISFKVPLVLMCDQDVSGQFKKLGPHRIEIGYPEVNGSDKQIVATAKIQKVVDGSYSTVSTKTLGNSDEFTAAMDLSVDDIVNKYANIVFDITFNADDVNDIRPQLQYFRFFSYRGNIEDGIIESRIVSDNNGPDMIISSDNTLTSNRLMLPELKKTPLMYYHDKSGIDLGSSTGKISYPNNNPIGDDLHTIAFWARVPSGQNNTELLSINDESLTHTTSGLVSTFSPSPSIYVNGDPVLDADIVDDEWNFYTVVFDDNFDSEDLVTLVFGKQGDKVLYMDNILLFNRLFQALDVNNLYNLQVYKNSYSVVDPDGANFTFLDNEDSFGYQPFHYQNGLFAEVDFYSTEQFEMETIPDLEDGTNTVIQKSSEKIDGRTPVVGNKIIIDEQTDSSKNGLYEIKSISTTVFGEDSSYRRRDVYFMEKIDISDKDVFYAKRTVEASAYSNRFFIYLTSPEQRFERTFMFRKVRSTIS
jgi:hypothetical protein